MFKRKACARCGKSLKESFSFCPYCGGQLGKREGDFGMLGRNDAEMNLNDMKVPGIGGFSSILNSLMKGFEKQLREQDRKTEVQPNPKNQAPGISISISTFGNGMNFPGGHLFQESGNQRRKNEVKKFFFDNFNSERLKKYSQLPKAEPKTNLKRLSDKLFYEVELPGVKSAKDVSIVNLEKSMELKAISEKKAYSKTIPMNFPISNYKLSKGKLVLEMDARGN